jgi:HlyD family secretion protein
VTGGTTLLTMAKLDTLQVRAMVDETDIGKIRSGMLAEVTVDAHPRELFSGTVIKVEPRAVTTQNVTTFPVLVRVLNDRDLLLPGMNVEVEIRTGSRENVLALPLEAIRSRRDYLVAAGAMGLDAEEAASLLEAAQAKSPTRGKPSIAFLARDGAPSPVPVGLGLANWDFAEILWGLEEGDSVAVTLSSGLLMQQDRWKNRMKSWSSMGSFKKGEDSKGKKPEARNGSSARGKRPDSSKRPKGKPGGGH